MQERSEELLVAYLDGELAEGERVEVEAWLAADPLARETLAELAESANLLRRAYDDILHEPVPERLIAAARGEAVPARGGAQILPFAAPRLGPAEPAPRQRRRWLKLPIAAALAGLLLGGAASYLGLGQWLPGTNPAAVNAPAVAAAAANDVWLDNAAGYFKLFASAGDNALIDVPPNGDPSQALQKISQSLPKAVRLPDLKPWGLNFRGARLVVVGGRPAAQLVYTTDNKDNKAIGPLTLIIGSSSQPDIPPTYDHRQDVNLLYWRHQGRAYAIVGQANIGYLWGIANDVAWQLDAI